MFIFTRILEAAKQLIKSEKLMRRLDSEVGADVGLHGNEIMGFALQSIEVAPRMSRMRNVYGLTEDGPTPERWRNDEMVRTCVRCVHKRQCARTLRNPSIKTEHVNFCPNRNHYASLAARMQSAVATHDGPR